MDESQLQTDLTNIKADIEKLKKIKDSKIIMEKLARIDEMLKWFDKTKDTIQKFMEEKRDKSARKSSIETGRPTHEDEHSEHAPSKEQIEAETDSFRNNYDSSKIKELNDELERRGKDASSVKKYQESLAYLNKWRSHHRLDPLTNEVKSK